MCFLRVAVWSVLVPPSYFSSTRPGVLTACSSFQLQIVRLGSPLYCPVPLCRSSLRTTPHKKNFDFALSASASRSFSFACFSSARLVSYSICPPFPGQCSIHFARLFFPGLAPCFILFGSWVIFHSVFLLLSALAVAKASRLIRPGRRIFKPWAFRAKQVNQSKPPPPRRVLHFFVWSPDVRPGGVWSTRFGFY